MIKKIECAFEIAFPWMVLFFPIIISLFTTTYVEPLWMAFMCYLWIAMCACSYDHLIRFGGEQYKLVTHTEANIVDAMRQLDKDEQKQIIETLKNMLTAKEIK